MILGYITDNDCIVLCCIITDSANTITTSEILKRQCDWAVPQYNRRRWMRTCRRVLTCQRGFQPISQDSGGQSPRKPGSVLSMIWERGWTRWPPGLLYNLSDYTKFGASHKGKCLIFSRTVEPLLCLQNTGISGMTPADHKILKHFWSVLTIYWRTFLIVVIRLSFTWGYWCTDTPAIVLALVQVPPCC